MIDLTNTPVPASLSGLNDKMGRVEWNLDSIADESTNIHGVPDNLLHCRSGKIDDICLADWFVDFERVKSNGLFTIRQFQQEKEVPIRYARREEETTFNYNFSE